jgi:uncharacterized protein YebE (UPF0316 family)
MEFNWFQYVILPFLIFAARIIDVSIGTIRMIFVSKGLKKIAPILGFFEVLIWIIVVKQIVSNASGFFFYIAYAGGFAAGNYLGLYIEEKISIGKVLVRVITQKNSEKLIETLKDSGYKITVTDAKGRYGEVKIIFTIIKRRKLKKTIEIIKKFNPKSFYTIEDVKFANEEFVKIKPRRILGQIRKSK